MRYFLHIAYNGFPFRGWQQQPKVATVQETLEKCLFKIFKIPVPCLGCGRTDAMVHASQFFAHIDLPVEWDYDLIYRINKNLPDSISVFDIIPVGENANARFDATQRTYDYFIHTYKDPFLFGKSSFVIAQTLDFNAMKRATELLLIYNDFKSFCICPANHNTTICNVSEANLYVNKNGNRIRFQISANRFLGCMIRILVSKLLQIGQGKMSLSNFEELLATQIAPPPLRPASPHGLYLSKIVYPYLNLEPHSEFMGMMTENWNRL